MSNSTIREAMDRLSATLAAEPSKAKARSEATARIASGLKCEVVGPRGERVLTDMPPAIGGDGSAPNPGWLLRAATASCLATVIAARAAKLGIELNALEVTVGSESDQRGLLGLDDNISAGLSAWRATVKIAGSAEPDTLRELVAWADAHAPVGRTLAQGTTSLLQVEVV